MKTLTFEGTSIGELIALIERQPGGLRHLFRGQGDAAWVLMPSLYRIEHPNVHAGTQERSYDHYEAALIDLFFREGHPYLPAIQRGYSNDRILAQHFGVPTRLLDWSRDPLVALYFALEDWSQQTDAAIYMLLPDAKYLPEQIKGAGPHQAIELTPPAIDRRIPAQKSVFTFHSYGTPDEPFVPLDLREGVGNHITDASNGLVRGFYKIIIPAHRRRLLFQSLLGMGVDRRNLFPGLDGVGADISQRANLGQVWD